MQNPFSSPYFSLLAGGDYQAIVKTAVDSSESAPASEDLPWIIGALTLLGRSTEAEGLFAARRGHLDQTSRMASRFFLSVAFCREGQHEASRKLLLENAREARIQSDSISQFFHCQGFAFYRYATGRLNNAGIWAEASLKAASGALFGYGQVLAFELLGHIKLLGGQFHAGFRFFNLAKEKSAVLGQGALYQAIEISTVLYRASYGIAANSAALIEMLDSFTGNEFFQDSYTQAALNLELARLYILRGELSRAKDQLNFTSEYVYRIDNPDLELDYNLQMALLLRSQGEFHQALSLVKGAKHRVRTGHDVRAQLKVLGLEYQLLKALGRIGEQDALLLELTKLSKRCGTLMAKRYLLRHHIEGSTEVRPGEDKLGDLIDRIGRFKEGVVEDILQSAWFGLLHGPLNVLPHESVLYFDAEPGSLTLFNKGEVLHLSEGCSTLVRKLISLLAQHPCSKETLANQIWRQSYNPSRHDSLIYALVAKARKCLGIWADWIEVHEFGYRLREGVRVASASIMAVEDLSDGSSINNESQSDASETRAATLNARQKIIYDTLKRDDSLEPGWLVKKLGVSDATISRDMSRLLELGLAKKLGQGRATRYYFEHSHV